MGSRLPFGSPRRDGPSAVVEAQGEAWRRGQDGGTDAAGVPARSLRDEPVDVRGFAASLLPTSRRCWLRASVSSPARVFRERLSRRNLSRRQHEPRQNCGWHRGAFVCRRSRPGAIWLRRFGSTRLISSRCWDRPMPSLAAAKVVWRAWRQRGTAWLLRDAASASWRAPGFSRRAVLASQSQDDDGGLGTAPRFPARRRRRRAVSLSRMHGQPDLWHGDRQGRRRHDHQGDDRRAEDQGRHSDPRRSRCADRRQFRRRATGVTLADGRRLEARRAVIANVHPKLVFGSLVARRSLARAHSNATCRRSGRVRGR